MFAEIWVTSGAQGSLLVGIWGARQLSPFGGQSSQRAVSTPPPEVESPPTPCTCTTACTRARSQEWFARHEFIGSSLLIVYDRNDRQKSGLWCIDFGRTHPAPQPLMHTVPWVLGNHEDGYLVGVQSLLDMWTSVLLGGPTLVPTEWQCRATRGDIVVCRCLFVGCTPPPPRRMAQDECVCVCLCVWVCVGVLQVSTVLLVPLCCVY